MASTSSAPIAWSDSGAGDVLAQRPALAALPATDVSRGDALPVAVITDRHAAATAAAQHQPLQQRRPLTRRSLLPVLAVAVCLRIFRQPPQDILVLLPGDVAGVSVFQEGVPLLGGHGLVAIARAVHLLAATMLAVDIRTGVAGITQHITGTAEFQRSPNQLLLTRAAHRPSRESSAPARGIRGQWPKPNRYGGRWRTTAGCFRAPARRDRG